MRGIKRWLNDRYGEKGIARGVSIFLSVAFLLFIGYILVRYRYFTYIVREELFSTPMFGLLLAGYAAALLLFVTLYRGGKKSAAHWAAIVFCMALLPRLAAYLFIRYIPTSDFANYYEMGLAFARGDYAAVASQAATYHIPDFVGLGVINGCLLSLFGTDIRAFQLVHCVITSLSCAAVYLVAQRFDEKAAPVAGFLFAVYPANIIYSQVTSNQHVGVLFTLLAVWLLLGALGARKLWKAALLALFSGISLLISQYAHPSTTPTLIAFSLYWLTLFLSAWKRKKEWIGLLCVAAAFALGLCGGRALANAGMDTVGLREGTKGPNSSYLAKVVIGLNPETCGAYSESDWGMIWSVPAEEQNELCLSVIRERLQQDDLWGLFDTKILRAWMVKDNSFSWATTGLSAQAGEEQAAGAESAVRDEQLALLDRFLTAYKLMDFFYVAAVFLFAWIGVFLRRRKSGGSDLILWIVLGWMGVHLLIEIQTRYRYLAMPFLMIFAAMGLMRLFGALGRLSRGKHKAVSAPCASCEQADESARSAAQSDRPSD